MNILKELEKFKRLELEEIKKDRKKGIPVRINPNSMASKEIAYQTILLKQVLENQNEIISMLKNINHD